MFENHKYINIQNGKLLFIESFFTPSVSDQLWADLSQNIDWRQGSITLFGKKVLEPRLSAWYADSGKSYTYSGKKQEPLAWIEPLVFIKKEIEKILSESYTNLSDSQHIPSVFNSVLCNLYRNGNDSMGWHQDNEPELGTNPLIASVNFGESRRFLFRYKADKTRKYELLLTHGSLLIMGGSMQHYWQHAVPKETRCTRPRINLTFRHIL